MGERSTGKNPSFSGARVTPQEILDAPTAQRQPARTDAQLLADMNWWQAQIAPTPELRDHWLRQAEAAKAAAR